MATTTSAVTVELVRVDSPLDAGERAAIAGFLAGYAGNTLISYTTDLRLFVQWCTGNGLRLFDVRRAHLEIFGRQMQADGRMRSTVARRLSTLGSFYRYCHVEGSSSATPQRTSVAQRSTSSLAPSGWTAMSSARCSCRPGSARHAITR